MSAESAMETYLCRIALAAAANLLVSASDSDERDNPPQQKLVQVFALAKKRRLPISPCTVISIRRAPSSISGAGTAGYQRGSTGSRNQYCRRSLSVAYIKRKKIGLTCCPVSNSFVVDDMKGKEILNCRIRESR